VRARVAIRARAPARPRARLCRPLVRGMRPRVPARTRVRYVFSNSASRAGSSNLHIYSFTVIQSSLKLARPGVSARSDRSVRSRTHGAGSSLIHNSSKGLMELQSSRRHSLTIFLRFALLFSAGLAWRPRLPPGNTRSGQPLIDSILIARSIELRGRSALIRGRISSDGRSSDDSDSDAVSRYLDISPLAARATTRA